MGLFMLVGSACATTTSIPKTAVLASEMPAQSGVLSADPTPTDEPLPAVSVYEITSPQGGYPAPVAPVAEVGNPYPVVVSDNTVLPAPVIVNNDAPPPLPTSIATVPVPTVTPSPTEPSAPTATPQATFTPPALPATSSDEHYWLRRPVQEGGVVWTDKFYTYGGTRGRTLRPHHGVEFNVPYDTPIIAVAAGTVVFAGEDNEQLLGPELNFYGKVVVIEHEPRFLGQPVYTLYAHLNEVYVAPGQFVQAEEVVGLSGATGVADGAHMHFEVRVGANDYASTRNPLLWLYPFPDRGTIAGRVVFPDGSVAYEAPVSIRRTDGEGTTATTTTYATADLNADEGWNENFAIDDVYAGFYEVTVKDGTKKYTAEVWVYPRQTSFVEIVVGN